MTWSDIDNVLLVGGSTRMPMVGQMLRQLSGKEPDGSVAVDEAVAHGAALHAGVILAKRRGETPCCASGMSTRTVWASWPRMRKRVASGTRS